MTRNMVENPVPPRGDPTQAGLLVGVLIVLVLLAGVAGALFLFSLRPTANMLNQPYHRPQDPSPLFADGASQRPLVTGVAPRPAERSPGIPYVAVRSAGPANFPVTAPSRDIPMPVTAPLLARGQERFTIYCSMCHGGLGAGDGMVVQRGMTRPPSFHNDRLRSAPDSHFFNVITNGYGAMFPYADRIAADDRWAIVAYIRALQLGVERGSLTAEQRQQLKGVLP